MQYFVNKIVGWVLSPYGLFYCGFLLAWILRWVGRSRSSVRVFASVLSGLVLVLFWVMGCGFFTRLIGVPLEGEECPPPTAWASVIAADAQTPMDAIVLLGGGMGVHKACGRPEMFAGADRAWTAARLWHALRTSRCRCGYPGPMMTVSGGGARAEVALLTDLGVATNCLVRVDAARNTEEEARFIMATLTSAGVDDGVARQDIPRIALVTSAWHMPRARMLFERVGFEVVPISADYEMHCIGEQPWDVGDFFPSGDALARNTAAVKEWVARVLYGLVRGQ